VNEGLIGGTFAEHLVIGISGNLIIPYLGFIIVKKCDREEALQLTDDVPVKMAFMAVVFAVCGELFLSAYSEYTALKMYDSLFLGAASGCLLFACVTDIMTSRVYDFIWWVAAGVEMAAYVLHPVSLWKLLCLMIFFVIQELLFAKLYGRADCHAFCICAVMESIFGMDITGFFFHMILSFVCLTVVQYFRGNIGKNGRLKISVPFIPYITFAFWFNMLTAKYTILC